MPKHKIAILITSLTGGGAERIVTHLLNNLAMDYEIHLILFAEEIEYELPANQTVFFLDKGHTRDGDAINILRTPILSMRLASYCNKNEIDLVLSLLARPNFVACLARRFGLKAKVLISERIYTPLWYRKKTLKGKIGKFLVSLLYPLADAILPNSQGTLDALRDQYGIKNNYFLVKNLISYDAISLAQTETVDDVTFEKFTFVCLAGFREQKNHQMLIRAFSLLDDPNAQLLLIGKGTVLEDIRSLVLSFNLQDRVLFLGPKTNPFKYLSRSDCLVLSSDFEGFPNVLIEALACGLPIISTDCKTGPRELLAESQITRPILNEFECGKHGLLVSVDDSKMMALAMAEMINNDELRTSFKDSAVSKAKEYDENVVIGEFKQIIDRHLPSA